MKNNKSIAALSIILALAVSITVIRFQEKRQKNILFNTNIKVADEYFIKDEYENAIEKYNDIIKMDEDNPLWYVKIAQAYLINGDLDNSRKYLEEAKQKNYKDDPEVLNYIISTELISKDYDEALKDGEKALEKFPNDNKIKKSMFTIYMVNKREDDAKKLFESYKPSKDSSFENAEYAGMLFTIGEKDKAYEALEDAFNINMNEPKIYDVIAQEASNNFNELLEQISTLSKNSPDNKFYKMCLAKIYSLTPDTSDMALDILSKIGLDESNVEIQILKLTCYSNKQDYASGDKLVNKLLNDYKVDYRILHSISWYYLKKGDNEKALEYCKSSIEKNKDYCDNYAYLMPQILNALGSSENRKNYFRKALYIEPYNYNIMLSAANFYANNSDFDNALEYYKLSEILKPNDSDIKYNIALIYINQNKNEEAITVLNQCIKSDPSISKYYRTLGTIYMVSGDYENGIKNIRSAYAVDETDCLALNDAGIYYIVAEENVERGYYNLLKAYEGLEIRSDYDKETVDIITENFKKAKNIYDIYVNAKSQSIEIPDFTLLY